MTASSQPLPILPGRGLAGLPRAAAVPVAEPPRRRAKLWDLSPSIHCSVIGTCLTTAELRRVMRKVAQCDVSHLSDHDLHGDAVGQCHQNNACSRLLQKALDQRHEMVIKRFARLAGEAAVLQAWGEACRAGDIPGAYWAVLTHPDVRHPGIRRAFGDVHMLSHLVGAANRADISRLAALEAENAALHAKVERQQIRMHDAITSRDTTIRQLTQLAANTVRMAAEPDPDDALAALRHLVADLQGRLATEGGRRERLEKRLADATEAARCWAQRGQQAEAAQAVLAAELSALERQTDADPSRQPVPLPARLILYVGGRPAGVEQMRAMLASAGGELLYHDGGRHDHPSLLPGLIGRADQVMFPVDCVSHDAALAVKRLCRQLGKPWAPLRSSGLGSFLAALA